MPARVTVKIKAQGLRAGDVGVDRGRAFPWQVKSVDVKTKLVWVTLEDDTETRMRVDEDVVVSRLQSTMAEIEDKALMSAARHIKKAIQKAPSRLETARAGLIEAMAYRSDFHSTSYAELVAAETELEIWKNVQATASYQELNLHDAALEVQREIQRELAQERFDSRSTSTMANAVSDVVNATKAAWLRRMEYVL